MKKLVAAALAVASLVTLMSCNKAEPTAAKEEGKVLNIYVWNDEFADRFNSYYAAKLPADVKVNFVQTPNQDNAYQNKLDEALLVQDKAAADAKIDIFLVEADYALKYVDTPYTLDVKKDIGLTDADLANQYKYTKDIMTDSKGNLKGVSWQACPGGFLYRRSYAKEVLGTDEPSEVQEKLADWAKFNAVAADMKAAGYYMLSGYDDAFRAFSDNMTQPWVVDNKIVIDPQIQAWIDQTKEYTDKGYNNKASLWSAESTQGMMEDGKVFGYFGPAWFIDFCMPHDEGSAFGDWAFCKGPQGFSWGGTWLCGAAGSDNVALIKDIMLTLTCDADTMTTLAKEKGDFANNEKAMAAVAASDYGNDFLAGQNHMAFFLDSAKSIDKSCMSMYDQGMNEKIQSAMKDYFEGLVDIDTAWANFYTSVTETYPNLSK
ncbi:MAG: ABC transporter substrate-binding protein [Treponema sp.]|nr:ABC transporter substrate-binding protein [Treponema sp.]